MAGSDAVDGKKIINMKKKNTGSGGKSSSQSEKGDRRACTKSYDDLARAALVMVEGIELESHKLVKDFEECRKKAHIIDQENQGMKQYMAKYKAEKDTQDVKLKHLRSQLDQEVSKRLKAEQNVDHMARQLQLIRELLLDKENGGTLSNQDRQALVQSLHHVSQVDIRSGSHAHPKPSGLNMSYTLEESSDMLSPEEFDATGDEILDDTAASALAGHRRKSHKRSFPSAPPLTTETESSEDSVKKQRVSQENDYAYRSAVRRRRYRRQKEVARTIETHVTVSQGNGFSPTKQVHFTERLEKNFPRPPPNQDRRPPSRQHLKEATSNSDLTDMTIDSFHTLPISQTVTSPLASQNRLFCSQTELHQKDQHQNFMTKQISVPNLYPSLESLNSNPDQKTKYNTLGTPRASGKEMGHSFTTKIAVRMETCEPCGKRLRFGSSVAKCRDCKVVCHPECKGKAPKPCVPTKDTPGTKKEGSIESYAPTKGLKVPGIVCACVEEIEKRGLNELGLYRVPGSDKDVKELKEKFLRGKTPDLSKYMDVHVVCGCLKDFLRGLSEPLVTFGLHESFMVAAAMADQDDCLSALYQCVSELPPANRDTLAFVMAHLQKVAQSTPVQMGVANLAKVFGPTLVGHRSSNPSHMEMLEDIKAQPVVVERLLYMPADYWNQFLIAAQQASKTPPFNPQYKSWQTPDTPITPETKPAPETMLGPLDANTEPPLKKKGSFHTPRFGTKHKEPSKRPRAFFDSPH